jgi:hypothetical protein
MRKSSLLGIVGIIYLIALLATDRAASAQAGSTGGTVGKTDKSASGGEEGIETNQKRKTSGRPQASRQRKTGGGSCQKIVGTWTWHYILDSETVLSEGGAGRNNTGPEAVWTCSAGIATATWDNGFVDTITISGDGNTLFIKNNEGKSFTADRK